MRLAATLAQCPASKINRAEVQATRPLRNRTPRRGPRCTSRTGGTNKSSCKSSLNQWTAGPPQPRQRPSTLAHFVMHDSQAACLLRVHRGLRELRCPYRQNERLPPCSDLDNCGHDAPYETPWRCPAPRLAPVPIHTDRPSLFRRPPPFRRRSATVPWPSLHRSSAVVLYARGTAMHGIGTAMYSSVGA